jgi:hypothetical protein
MGQWRESSEDIAIGVGSNHNLRLIFSSVKPQIKFSEALVTVGGAFWGIQTPVKLSGALLVFLTVARFTFFGLFMAVLVKRLSRR